MTKEASSDLVRELCRIQTSEDLTAWKQHREITPDQINAAMAEVRRLLEIADFELANRLSEWCLLLGQEFADPMIRARATVTRGIALARASEDARALPYYDEA